MDIFNCTIFKSLLYFYLLSMNVGFEKNSINENFDFRPKFEFLRKICINDEDLDFCGKF